MITHKESGKSYIGKSNDPKRRWRGHKKYAQKGSPRPLYCAMRKYGVEAFTFEVFEHHSTEEEAYHAEEYWVTRLREFGVQVYNLNDGGEGGCNPSEETRRKLSEAARKAAQNRPPISDETRRKLSEAHQGRKHTEEARRKMSEAHRNPSEETRRKLSEANRNRPPASEETRRKMSEAKRGKKRSEETRRKMSDATKRREAAKRLAWLLVDEQ